MIACLFATLMCLAPADDIVARAQGLEVGKAEYSAWLVERMGFAHLEEYMIETLILREAEARGQRPTAAELEAAHQSERNQIIARSYRGDEQAYKDDLRYRGQDPEAHDARRKSQLEPELCLDRMARARREVTDELLRARYAVIYGDLGEAVSVDVLFFSLYHGVDPEAPRPDLNAQAVLALARAQAAEKALRAGRPFEELRANSDPVQNEFVQDGHISQWRKNLLGDESELGLASLDDPGDVSPPIRVWDGYYVMRLVQRRQLDFEQAREELTALVIQDKPTAEEIGAVRTAIRNEYKVELLLR
jgi:hypothetical protein